MWRSTPRSRVLLACLLLTALAAGCRQQLMATPNLYVDGLQQPWGNVPADVRGNTVEVLYVTDRAPQTSGGALGYGFERCGSLAFGTCAVSFGDGVAWDELDAASRVRHRKVKLWLETAPPVELGRLPPTPAAVDWVDGKPVGRPQVTREREAAEALLRDAISQRLARVEGRDVYVFVHGFNTSFSEGVSVIAQLWHFLGRRGEPIVYSWPSQTTVRGGLRAYTYDRESGEFTVFHLKQFLILLGSIPEVQRVHIVAHSRGADVALTALRELHLAMGGRADETRARLKLGTVVLAAPDIDLKVMEQRMTCERLDEVPQRLVVYVSEHDWALGLADWIFAGTGRVGGIEPGDVTPYTVEQLRSSTQLQIIEADVSGYSRNQHDYFYTHPAVSSDLILVLRGHLDPGPENGRPLERTETGVWRITNAYPEPPPPP